MGATWNLDAISAAFTQAAIDPAQWAPAMDRVVDAIGAAGAGFVPFNVKDRPLGLLPTAGVAEPFDRYIKEGWYKHDLRNRGIPKMLSSGIAVDQDCTSAEERRWSPFYNDFLGRHGLKWYAGVAFKAGEDNWGLAIQRTIKQGPFTAAEQKRLRALRGPLTIAATIARELGYAQARGMADAFDVAGMAAFLLDRQGQVIRMNTAAEMILGRGVRIVDKRLMADDHKTSNAVGRLIFQAISGSGDGSKVMPPVSVSRAGQQPLVVYALPLAGVIRDMLSAPRAMVIVRDLGAQPRPSEAHLRAGFGLTAAETRLAMRLAAGEPLERIADEFGVAYETARSRLKAIFFKTGTHRQAELVALLARMLAGP